MKKCISVFVLLCFPFFRLAAQDTFSICAVDSVTGEVGSAGASCIDASQIPGGVVIISDVHPGVGVVHTQSYWIAANQNYAQSLMTMGLSPQQIIDSLVAHDAGSNPLIRQYGIADMFNGSPRVAAYTGTNCLNYKNHITGTHYAIQGNILLGQQILDSMEARFLNTPGDLACKLMAALQGAKVPGADTRCLTSGNSSKSSFLRVATPADTLGSYSIDINVPQGPAGFEPIDSLQVLFDNIHSCPVGTSEINSATFSAEIFPNPFYDSAVLKLNGVIRNEKYHLDIFNNHGMKIFSGQVIPGEPFTLSRRNISPGINYFRVSSENGSAARGKLVVM